MKTKAQHQMVFVRFGSGKPTMVGQPVGRPHLAVQKDVSDQTAAVYNCMDGSSLYLAAYRTFLINITVSERSVRSLETHCQQTGDLTNLLSGKYIGSPYSIGINPPDFVTKSNRLALLGCVVDGYDERLQHWQERWWISTSSCAWGLAISWWNEGTSLLMQFNVIQDVQL